MNAAFRFPLYPAGSLPHASVFCPANGYILDPGAPYVPPIDVGTPNTEEIILLCTNNAPGNISLTVTTSAAAQYYAEIYDDENNLITTTANVNSGVALTFTFPVIIPNSLYVMKIKPVSGSITVFKVNATATADYQVLQARFNTPNITSLQYAFQYVQTIKNVAFDCTLNYLTDTGYMFRYSGINEFTFPTSLPELTDAGNMFYQSDIVRMNWSSSSTAPKLTIVSGILQLTRNAISASFPASLPELTSFSNLVRASNIQQITLFTSAPKVTSCGWAFYDTPNLYGEITLPEMPLCTQTSNAFNINSKITKVKYQGNMNATWADAIRFYDTIREMKALTEFEFPRQMATWCNTTFASLSPRLQKIKLPDIITASALTAFQSIGIASSGANLKEVTGDFDNSGSVQIDCYWNYSGITVWNTPKMRCTRFRIGAGSTNCAPVTSVEIDWANSNYSAGAAAIYLYCSLDATELNRIFTALPTVTGKTIYIKGNPGTATCNKTIATGKGWTVNTTT